MTVTSLGRLHSFRASADVNCEKVEWITPSLDDDTQQGMVEESELHLNGITTNSKYTSLRDIIPCSSPSSVSVGSPRWDIPIKNPLVKQAACAYLQPMLTERDDNTPFFIRCWTEMSPAGDLYIRLKELVKIPFQACINFFTDCIFPKLSRAFSYFMGKLRPQGIVGVAKEKK